MVRDTYRESPVKGKRNGGRGGFLVAQDRGPASPDEQQQHQPALPQPPAPSSALSHFFMYVLLFHVLSPIRLPLSPPTANGPRPIVTLIPPRLAGAKKLSLGSQVELCLQEREQLPRNNRLSERADGK